MAASTFKTNPYHLEELLRDAHHGRLQLPDFQRSWVWDEDRIKSLIASISRAFPVGALMTLETGGGVNFQPRPIEGTPEAAARAKPQHLLLDGQQRITSLYQTILRGEVVETVTARNKRVKRWFYIDVRAALDPETEREEAIVGVREDRRVTSDIGRVVEADYSTRAFEHEHLMFPVTAVFDWDEWQDGLYEHWRGREGGVLDLFRTFKSDVLQNFKKYQIPVIALDRDTSKEAVCVVFEKVNTGGKPLDAFELVTAMYAADGYELRKDWLGDGKTVGRAQRLARALHPAGEEVGLLKDVASTDLLQTLSLFSTREKREAAVAEGRTGKDVPGINANRQALLNLPLDHYLRYVARVEDGFVRAAKFLHRLHIYRPFDLPYQSQLVPLAAVLADLGDAAEHDTVRRRLAEWYWNGVFGELYGSTTETRFARDFVEVSAWIVGDGPAPTTIRDATFRADRLITMRTRLSAAYKGVNALLMNEGARDFRSGQRFDHAVFFGENVDIHHIFPKAWCQKQGIPATKYDSIINKTPLSAKTNRIIGGHAPSHYIRRLEEGAAGSPSLPGATLDGHLASHLIDPMLLRTDDFDAFFASRQEKLLAIIQHATGQAPYRGTSRAETEEDVIEDEVQAHTAEANTDEASDVPLLV